MTIVLSHKEYKGLDGLTWFVEKYQEKFCKYPFWRYGTIDKETNMASVISFGLWSRPNLKKLNII